jgi:hypothetical protein
MLQSLLFFPGVALYFSPLLITLIALLRRLYLAFYWPESNANLHALSDFIFVLIGLIAIDFQWTYLKVTDNQFLRGMFPFIDPFRFFRIAYEGTCSAIRYCKAKVVWLIKKLVAPFMRASLGALHYIKLVISFV